MLSKLNIYHIETMGTLDGPGVRTVIFLQGCNMKCGYCHNPDSWSTNDNKIMTSEQLLAIINRYKMYYGHKGGVTFSGGEPLLQSNALLPLVHKLKEEGIHVALDTSGSVFNNASKKILDTVDLVILDIKSHDEDLFKKICHYPIDNTLRTLEYIQKSNISHWIRQVEIKGLNDHENEKKALNDLTDHPKREKIEWLPEHNMGDYKWASWQLTYKDSHLR
jgi:pyruvate formate lyase activating enzyme